MVNWNLKEIYRGEKKQKKKEELQKEDKKRTEERQDKHNEENLIEPLFKTPPQRVFPELDGISKYQNTKKYQQRSYRGKSMPITEDAVVDTINRFRKGIDDEVKEDNKKKEEKIPYQRFELSPLFSEKNEAGSKLSSKEHKFLKLVIPKVKELKDIFKQCGWENGK
ncbi:unnamed protein product [Rhizophagus irregularis]|uniref:Uncharacterized protein n=1 Tax=Rhizophagus irregularis TaxID=588596 RepID=A0A916E0R4_9GLOM|nr:unnamed protein product [Rhizophagus irregularis]CAB5321671.1 unnamed protein product [Rhizophagus irregularis]